MDNSLPQKLISPKTRRSRLAAAAVALTSSAVAFTVLTATPTVSHAEPVDVATVNGISKKDAIDKYFDMGYDYIDSLVLAAHWEEKSFYDAKVRLGAKILAFGPEDGEFHIRDARSAALKKDDENLPFWIDAAGYTFDDAELLGDFWKSKDVWESKITMIRMMIGGHLDVIDASLKAAKSH
ncbi:MAG: hypothetical protein AAF585_02540 [Verrucomicrobiota bacterium]